MARSRIVSALAARRWVCARLIGSAVVIAVGLGNQERPFVSGTKGRAFRGATLIRRCRTLVTDGPVRFRGGRSALPCIAGALRRSLLAPAARPLRVRSGGSRVHSLSASLRLAPTAGSLGRRATGTRPVHSPLFVMCAEYGSVDGPSSAADRQARRHRDRDHDPSLVLVAAAGRAVWLRPTVLRFRRCPLSVSTSGAASIPTGVDCGWASRCSSLTAIGLLAIIYSSLQVESGVRAYVGGEGLYSKGQKDAVYHLIRYAGTTGRGRVPGVSRGDRHPARRQDRPARAREGEPGPRRRRRPGSRRAATTRPTSRP